MVHTPLIMINGTHLADLYQPVLGPHLNPCTQYHRHQKTVSQIIFIYISIYLSDYLFVYVSMYVCVNLIFFIYLSIYLSIYPSESIYTKSSTSENSFRKKVIENIIGNSKMRNKFWCTIKLAFFPKIAIEIFDFALLLSHRYHSSNLLSIVIALNFFAPFYDFKLVH